VSYVQINFLQFVRLYIQNEPVRLLPPCSMCHIQPNVHVHVTMHSRKRIFSVKGATEMFKQEKLKRVVTIRYFYDNTLCLNLTIVL